MADRDQMGVTEGNTLDPAAHVPVVSAARVSAVPSAAIAPDPPVPAVLAAASTVPGVRWSVSDSDLCLDVAALSPVASSHPVPTEVGAGGSGDWDEGDDEGMAMFTRISSNDIIYRVKHKRCKVVGHYIFGDLLGEGAFGKVKECIDKDTLERKAVKIFKRRKLKRKLNGEQNLQREIVLLKRLRHNNILRLYDVLHNKEKQKIYMVLEFCVCQLKEMLDSAYRKKFPLWQAHNYFRQLMDGVEYLHSQGVIHNDIKPANLLLAADRTVKLCDLGTAEQLNPYSSSDVITCSQGSPAFQPPEIANGHESFSGFKVDVWSCGVTLFNFVTGQYPFEGDTVFRLYDSIGRGRFQMPADVPEPLAALLEGMLRKEADHRFSVTQIRKHEWYRKRQPRTAEQVPIPPRNGDELHSLTVLPYIWHRHYGTPDGTTETSASHHQLPTEHQLDYSAVRDGMSSSDNVSRHHAFNQSSMLNSFRAKSWSHCRQS